MAKRHFVVTDVEAGWDCVIGLYEAETLKQVESLVKKEYGKNWEDSKVIHEQYLEKLK